MGRPCTEPQREKVRAAHIARNPASGKRQCAMCLRLLGFGIRRSARQLNTGRGALSKWYKQAGIVTDQKHNGFILKGKGQRHRSGIKMAIIQMKARARKCLSTKPPKIAIFYPAGCDTVAQKFKWRYDNDIEFRIVHLLRRRIRKVIETGVKRGSSIELLGCSTAQFRKHIEDQFELGMSWDNQGEWQLDHVKPCAAHDLTDEMQQRACFHYMNYRPLWRSDNASKNSWYQGKLLRVSNREPIKLGVL